MAGSVFDLFAKLSLDSTEYENGLDRARGHAESGGSKIGAAIRTGVKAAGVALAAAGTAVVAFGKSSVDAGMQFDVAMSQVAATMGMTVDELTQSVGTADTSFGHFEGNLREFAQFLGANTAFSATQAAEALNYMALAGYSTQESMDMLPSVLSLAAAGSFDLARASDMVTDTQTAFGISAERTALMVDEMAKAASTGNTSVQQLGDAFLVVGGLAKELNGGFIQLENGAVASTDGVQDLEIALTAMANAGVKGSEAGTHMRNMLLKLADPSKEGAEAFEKLGVSVFDSTGKMKPLKEVFDDLNKSMSNLTQQEKLEAISAIFNTRDTASAEALLAAVASDWDAIGESILNAKVPLDDVKTAIEGTGIAVDDLEWGLDQFAVDIRDQLTTSGKSVEETAQMISRTWGISLEDARKAVNAVKVSLDEAQGAAAKMAETQLDNLAGDITLFKSALEGAKIAISDSLSPTLREFVQYGTESVSKLGEAFRKDGLGGALQELGPVIDQGIGLIFDKLPKVLEAAVALLEALVSGIINNLPKLVPAAVQLIRTLSQHIVENLPQLLDAALEIITTLADGIVEVLPELIPAIVEIVTTIVQKLTEPNTLTQLVMAALQIIIALANGLIQAIPQLLEAIPQIISNLVGAIVANLPVILSAGVQILASLVTGILGALPQIIALAPEILAALAGGIVQGIKTIIDVGGQVVDGFLKGISDAWNGMIENVKQFFSNFIDVIKGLFGIHSPSTVFADIGKNLLAGLIQGFFEDSFEFISDVLAFGGDVIGTIKGAWESAKEIGSNLLTNIHNGVAEKASTLFEAAATTAQNTRERISTAWENAKELGSNLLANIQNGVSEKASGLVEGATKIASTTREGISKTWESAKTIGSNLATLLSNGVSEKASDLVGKAADIAKTARDGITKTWDGAKTIGSNFLATIRNGVSEKASDLAKDAADIAKNTRDAVAKTWDGVKTIGSNFTAALQNGIGEKLSTVVDSASKIAKGVYDSFSKAWSNAKTLGNNLISQLQGGVSEKANALTESIKKIGDSIGTYFRTFAEKAKTLGSNIIQSVRAGIGERIGDIRNQVQELGNALTSVFRNLADSAGTWGRDLIGNFVEGLKEKLESLKNQAIAIAQEIKNHLGFSEPKEGPLSNFHTYAPDMMELFAKGIKDNAGLIKDAVSDGFDLRGQIMNGFDSGTVVSAGPARTISSGNSGNDNRNLTVILQLDRTELGRAVYQLNNEETQRVGVQLAGGFA